MKSEQLQYTTKLCIFTAQLYTSAVYAVVVFSSICPSVHPSQAGTVPKRLNAGSRKQRETIDQGIRFWRNSNGFTYNAGAK